MAYKALYRTYRPQLFREVVGQDVVVKTLQNAIANKKISHAYLFSGPRGTGKTTIARIFAKALNCENLALLEPCEKCTSCHEVSDGISPDVIEIDAASNNGVDEMRDLRDKVKFLPSGAHYKIYIIDEVHMLSPSAFNALLKTLEEPPSHVVFILATTEPQKLPATIISRCQRFEFKSLTVNEITKKLRSVCSKEEVEISEEALNAISETAEGALRDALGILDQAISYGDKKVTIEDVNIVTGNLSYDKLLELADNFENKNINGALEIVSELIEMGKEVNKLVNALLQFYRDILLYKNVTSASYNKYIFGKEKFKELATNIQDNKIFYYIDILSDVQSKIKYAQSPQIYLEVALIKMINMSASELNLIDRIKELEAKIENVNLVESENGNTIDNEQVNLMDIKLNRVISELNKLELHKLIQRIDDLENIKPVVNENGVVSDNSEIYKQLSSLQETLLLFKTNYNNIKAKVESLESVAFDNKDTIELNKRLELLEKRSSSILENDFASDIKYLHDDLDSLKVAITNISNNKSEVVVDNTQDMKELNERLICLEKKLYELISGHLSTPTIATPAKRVRTKNDGQILLFGDDLLPINEFKQEERKDKKENTQVIENITINKIENNDSKNSSYDVTKDIIAHEKECNIDQVENEAKTLEENEKTDDGIYEVINKVNSVRVTTKRDKVDLFERERKLMEEELKTIRPVVNTQTIEEKQEEKNINSNNDIYSSQTSYRNVNDSLSSYDVKILEKILHESRTESARNDMKRITQMWTVLNRGVNLEYEGIVRTLQEGKVVAVGNREFIITYKDAVHCNNVMATTFKKSAMKVLYSFFGDTYNYMALPEYVWLEKRQEYVNQYNIGIKYPKLTIINDPDLIIINNEYKDQNEKIVERTIETFGKDFVKFE